MCVCVYKGVSKVLLFLQTFNLNFIQSKVYHDSNKNKHLLDKIKNVKSL